MANLKDTIKKIENIRDTEVEQFTFNSSEITPEEIIDKSKDIQELLNSVIKDLNKIRDDLLHPAMQNIIT